MSNSPTVSGLVALIRNESNDGWLRYSNPERIVIARNIGEVVPVLESIEQAGTNGYTAIGYVAYEAAPAFDASLQCHAPDLPLLLFGIFRSGEACEPGPREAVTPMMATRLSRSDYTARIAQVKSYLQNGESYQVNLTHQLTGDCQHDPEALFLTLFHKQPSSRSVFLSWEDHAICCVTPELFFKLDGNQIEMEPMKGTRPRGDSTEQDRALHLELQKSEKERAENLMIVDMIRNDLGKISTPGSLSVDRLFEIIELPTLWQQVSMVSARTNAGLADIFGALFPCASVTGAPKTRTMEIIRELESGPRGVYTGAVGVVKPGRKMQFNVAIRTLVIDLAERTAAYGAGSGIVWDSKADAEWLETLNKAEILTASMPPFCLLETMGFHPERGIARLQYHLQRMHNSAHTFGFVFEQASIEEVLNTFSAPDERRLRLLLSRNGDITLEDYPRPVTSGLVRLKLADLPIASDDPFLNHKTTHRQVYERARKKVRGCDDVILWNERGELTETTICNLYLEIDGALLTPCANSGLLPGTYRRTLLESGAADEAILYKDDLAKASRLFISNSVRGLCEATLIIGETQSTAA